MGAKQPLPTLLVIGQSGQLAQSFKRYSESNHEFDIHVIGRPVLDLCESESIRTTLDRVKPQYVINAAAYTAVDKAEDEQAKAFEINAVGVKHLADECARNKVQLIHVSTDYVFDGSKRAPLTEEDEVAPLGAYGRSKLAGEWAVQSICPDAIILRTSWVYSDYGNNFVQTMLRLAGSRDQLSVVNDQFGRPTNVNDLTEGILHIIRKLESSEVKEVGGVYHFSNAGSPISWCDFAVAIFNEAKKRDLKGPSELIGIPSEEYPTPTERPKWSVMDLSKFEKVFGFEIAEWDKSLTKHFKNHLDN